MDFLTLIILRTLVTLLNWLPYQVQLVVVLWAIRFVCLVRPKYFKIARKNIEIVFPVESAEKREQIFTRSFDALARSIVDFIRMPLLDKEWFLSHIECPQIEMIEQTLRDNPERGILVATGHLGSFELLPHYFAFLGHHSSFVVRNFKLKRVDTWWTKQREASGCKVIGRKGAFKDIVQNLEAGSSVGVLFDQNVTVNHAIFPPFFGKPAATTKALGLAALRTEAPLMVMALVSLPEQRYRVLASKIDTRDIYQSASLSNEEKVHQLTCLMNQEFEKMILTYPEGWFWMHRRWKTRPEGETENVYQ